MWSGFTPELTRVDIPVKELPSDLEGISILHLTDLHSASFGDNQEGIFKLLEGVEVDMTVITGDLVDYRKKDIEPAMVLIKRAQELGPVYFVPGNHEYASGMYGQLKEVLVEEGVIVLERGETAVWKRGNAQLTLAGIGIYDKDIKSYSGYKRPVILLSHYPRVLAGTAGKGIDLVLAGHTHGGQVRLPWVGALYVPGQGKFPRYDAGLFKSGETYMYISRGLGTSEIPVRFLCRPEVAVITLERDV